MYFSIFFFFFFQAEDGIRDADVTGVQTCPLPIYATIALGGALPWILRRPTVYEVAITGAFCFAMGGLYVLLREVTRQSGPRGSGLALSGVLYGLAVLSRPTLGLVAIAMAVPA